MKRDTPAVSMQGESSATTSRLRVAYVVHTLDVGGLERCVARLCNHLDRARFQPMVICLNRSGSAAGWISATDVPIVELHKRPSNDLRLVGRLTCTLREHRVDVVHSHNWGTLIETSLARRRARVPAHVHAERGTLLGDTNLRGMRMRLRTMAARWAMNRADRIVTVAGSLRHKILAQCGSLPAPVEVIPNGVETPVVTKSRSMLADLRRSLGIPTQATVLGSVGRLAPVKGFGDAIDTAWQLQRNGHDIHVILVGDGPERARLLALAKAKAVEDRVHLVGRQEDIGNWLAIMDIYLNVSMSEGMSQSILEAMAMGLPCVVTDVGDSRLLVGGQEPCGLVVPLGHPAAIAEAVDHLIRHGDLVARFQVAAQTAHRERYCMETMIQAYESLYWQLIRVHHCGSSTEENMRLTHDAASMASCQDQ